MRALVSHVRSARVVICAIGIGASAAVGAAWSGVHVNWTSSMPIGAYLETAATMDRNSLILICLPEAIARVGRARRYLPAGSCPDGSSPVLKQVLGLPGDQIELHEEFLAVNRREIEGSQIEPLDSLGRPLDHVVFGSWTVREGELWVIGLNRERSWDSRYFGPLPISAVIGAARPLLTFPGTGGL